VASAFRRKSSGTIPAVASGVSHPYPPHHPDLPYTGKYYYSLTFRTVEAVRTFVVGEVVDLAYEQIQRAARKYSFEITAYCFMPDHVHLIVRGLENASDCKAFIKAAKQYSAYHFKQQYSKQLWQRYGFERWIRDDRELAFTIGYIVANPVRAGLVEHPADYPYVGSERYTLAEMLEMCEYSNKWVAST
jgi:REP-associated tyrosine transposase